MWEGALPPRAHLCMKIRCFAKINLTLDIFSKRADGYHSLATVMQSIALHDLLALSPSEVPGIHFTCEAPDQIDVPADSSNLVVRAAHLLWERAAQKGCPLPSGLLLHLRKRVPSQAGLGGGSSDAAATLWAMQHFFRLSLSPQELLECAQALGSDVPFFLLGGTVVARGRGEQLTPLPDIPPFWLVIVKPDIGISTKWAYEALDARPDRRSHRATKRMEEAILHGDFERVMAFQCNDFEQVVFEAYPQLAWLADEIRMAGALQTHLCGSGSALYGVFSDQRAALHGAELLGKRYSHVYVTHTLTRERFQQLRLAEEECSL
ncbi:4-diphosphocytidyl-2-C-methyl-D-erythritol kinase [Chthonomonas calidirosea]|nr:4-diphosphocytidyl-2-C-methyl-D-erythritol kinase [Chthonomonas calidirosea]